ncbi:SDR family NAD(P)-dependent oxidoreductase [Rubrivirga sp. S365]|uniref:SDR family oxidoreductase n=1 Tax=Rubrivirga sp. S365 TaxID=3076080 RepID=UPI0028C842FD|nr:SDR family NAD(P)-dependent oxidoreductase [Rubrivirga sp. S365]MDT7855912.1 SDR family NAD(P)-dependent oxidoreductase [Rubrivirga sp. S365]
MHLHDTAAVVTGASRGIGLATARLLADAGAHVYGLARSTDDLEQISQTLGDRFSPVVCDVTDAEAVRRAIDGAAEDAGRLDVLVNNAGLGRFGDVDALAVDDWQVQIDTNLSGAFYCTRAAVPHMKRQGEERGRDETAGFVVNVASIAGLIGNPQLSAYNASKHGLRGFSDAIMKELRPHGIKVSCLYPGSVDTAFGGDDKDPNPDAMSPESIAATVLHVLQAPHSTLISEVVLRPMVGRK